MEGYRNFSLAAYVYAYYLDGITEEKLRRDLDFYCSYLPLRKAYLECHRALVDIPVETLRMVKRVFEEYGIITSGGFTTTVKEGERKPSMFDCFCYSDEAHRKRFLDVIRKNASVFDEFILDDYFFAPCRCEKCITLKGKRSWADFRHDQMTDFSKEVVKAAKEVNPKCTCIIKYPNWYESYVELGYVPGTEKDIFDLVYTGTESRNSNYNGQHLQRYLSYSLVRLMENIAPGRNGGGWIDLGGSSTNLSIYLQQAELTLFAKAKELMLFNFASMIDSPAAGALGIVLRRVDALLPKLGKPVGISAYEPFDTDGEDQLLNYLGQCGLPLEPKPYFDEAAGTILLTQNSAKDPDAVDKLEAFVRSGGIGVVTSGFVKAVAPRMEQMTSVKVTDRKVSGTRYQITNFNVSSGNVCMADEPATFTVMQHKNNATWYDVLLHVNDLSTAVITEDNYGKGLLYILNIPDNPGDLYRLPREVLGMIGKDLGRRSPLYLSAPAPYELFLYDNDVFGVYNLNEFSQEADVVLLGEEWLGFEDLETGARYETPHHLEPRPRRTGDNATFRPEPLEQAFRLHVMPGTCRFYRLIRK